MSKSSAPRASESSASASSSKTGDSDPTGTGTSSSASDGDGADPASLSDAERSEIAADARAVATAGGKTVREYTYCVAAKGDVGDIGEFESTVFRTLNNARGWPRAGAVFTQVSSGCDMTIYLSEARYMTWFSSGCSAEYSCRVGQAVIINLTRWDHGVDAWMAAGGTLPRYRRMVINHEVGHRLGHIDNEITCDAAGNRAPLMQEQSMDLRTCIPNEWPLDSELWIAD